MNRIVDNTTQYSPRLFRTLTDPSDKMEKNPYSIETERLQLLRYTRDQDTSLAMSHDKLNK